MGLRFMKTSRSFSIRMDHQFWLSVNKNLIQAKEIDLNDFQKNLGDQQKKYFQQNELMKIQIEALNKQFSMEVNNNRLFANKTEHDLATLKNGKLK